MQEPLNDDELQALLRRWEAPAGAPAGLERKLMAQVQEPWWRWLWTGSVPVPVPVALAVLLMFGMVFAWRFTETSRHEGQEGIQAGLDPVKEWKPRIIRSSYVAQ